MTAKLTELFPLKFIYICLVFVLLSKITFAVMPIIVEHAGEFVSVSVCVCVGGGGWGA